MWEIVAVCAVLAWLPVALALYLEDLAEEAEASEKLYY